ncbi:hypothetical protein JMN32_10565 [Fulvivirga sp. 29W222]|uniref:Condensation domain-containing protein n=1 Tax=Fulvivirga marina TaxID=2494733 RepID=A0A937G1G8_9BACT|nr:condensation domain-containing protein [Fulvivirga marina]MBL6446756.1 hypothetical protein [Fulvivirga marina]
MTIQTKHSALLLLEQANREGVQLSYNDGSLAVRYKKGKKVNEELLKSLKTNKDILVAHFEKKQIHKNLRLEAEEIEVNGSIYFKVGPKQNFWIFQNTHDKSVGKLSYEFKILGTLDLNIITTAINYLFQRHESLRSNFCHLNGINLMSVQPKPKNHFYFFDVRDSNEKELLVQQYRSFKDFKFDLESGPLCIIRLIQEENKRYTLSILAHHIIFDKLSKEVFLGELLVLYQAFSTGQKSPLPNLPFQLKEYLSAESRYITRNCESHKKYWKTKFPELPNEFISPINQITNAVRNNVPENTSLAIDQTLLEKVNCLAKEHSTTAFIILQAVFHIARLKKTRQEDTIIGTALFNRDHPDFKNQIGYYADIVLIRTVIKSTDNFHEIVQTVKRANDDNIDFRAHSLMDHTWRLIKAEGRTMTGHYWKFNLRYEDHRNNPIIATESELLRFQQVKSDQDEHINLDIDCHFLVDRNSTLSLKVRYDSGLYDTDGIHSFIRLFEKTLCEV